MDVPLRKHVDPRVGVNPKILRPIVRTIAIDVMHHLARLEHPAKRLLGD